MDVIQIAADALKPVSDTGIIVQQGWYDASLKQLHVTLWSLGDREAGYSDDECEIEAASIQVNIWSDRDQQQLKKQIKKLMKAAGFLYIEGIDEMEQDTRIFINAMRFQIIQEAEAERED